MAQQHLDRAYQSEEMTAVAAAPSRSSSPESSSGNPAEQNQLNYAQEKEASTSSDKGVCMCVCLHEGWVGGCVIST